MDIRRIIFQRKTGRKFRFAPKVWATLSAILLSLSAICQFPQEFQRVEILTNLNNAINFEFAPDGRIFIVDRYGELLIYKPSIQSVVSAGNIPVFHELEDGFLGLAFDPDFSNNSYVYIHYSPLSESVNRVSRFTMNGDLLDLSSEVMVLQWPTQRVSCCHSGGDLDFDSQGNLYIATGDNTDHSPYAPLNENDLTKSAEKSSSNTNDLRGKILRITPQPNGTYTIPTGNLFPGGNGGLPEIYVMGARNPFKIFVDKESTDWLFWGEVGPDASTQDVLGPQGRDEINLTKVAGNHGWPYFSANNLPYLNKNANPQYYYDPLAPLNESVWNTGAVTLPPAQPSWLDFYHDCWLAGPRYHYDPSLTDQKRLPVEFDGAFFYFDFNLSKIWLATMDINGNILQNERFSSSVFPNSTQTGFIDIKIGPDGFLYILEYGTGCCANNTGTGKLVKVDYIGIVSNSSPVVTMSADVTSGSLPLTVNFSSTGTFDPDGDPLTYQWDFQTDGIIDSNQENPSFTYTSSAVYNAQLRVSDDQGGESVKNITIYAGNNSATFTFNSPVDGGFVSWSDDISFDLQVDDVEDGSTSTGEIDCQDINVVPSLGHLSHFHDDLTLDGCPKTLNLDPTDHDIYGEMDIYYVLNTNYTDQGGLTSFDQIRLYPKRQEAEYYDSQGGITDIINNDPWGGGNGAIRADHDGYVSFTGRNLLNINSVKYRVSSSNNGGVIELRLGSPTGTLLVSTNVPVTNDWIEVESSITDPGGKNDLFFVFKNSPGQQDIFDLNWIEFVGSGVSIDNTPPVVNEVFALTQSSVSVEFSEYVSTSTAEQIGNYLINNGISITSAVLQPDNRTVILTTSQMTSGSTYNITVSNVENTSGIPLVSGSYTFSLFNAVRINGGGPAEVLDGNTFIADQYAVGGNTYNNNVAITGTNDDAVYQTERYGDFKYEIPVPESGNYDLILHFAELYFGLPGGGSGGGAGSRVFSVDIENGQKNLIDYDIFMTAGGPATVVKEGFSDVFVSDGFLTVTFIPNINNPKVSAIEVLPAGSVITTPSVTINSPSNNADVNQPFSVSFTLENWTIQQGDTHMHYFIDGNMVGPHYSLDPIEIDGLSLGNHTITLELFDASHVGTGIYDEVTVNVTGQIVCNPTTFPSQWQQHLIDAELPYRSIYILPYEDIDGDGLKDIVTGAWWYKNPGSASGNWTRNTVGSPFNNVAWIHDFDGDGDKDLFGTQGTFMGADLVWAENDGSGNFTVHANLPSGTTDYHTIFIAGIAGGVFQSGGPYQMAISWNGGEEGTSQVQMVTVPSDPVNGTWTIEDLHPTSLGEGLNAGDIDNDGDLDLFQAGNWLRNDGGNWTLFSTGVTLNTKFDRNLLVDIDRDGDLDGVAGQIGINEELIWLDAPTDPTQNWTKFTIDADIDGTLSLGSADMDFDGDQDVIVGEWKEGYKLYGFENDLCNSGTWIKHTIDDSGILDHHDGAQVVDIDNDGDLDIVSIGWVDVVPRIFENLSGVPSNTAPVADAGPDQSITLPTNSIVLNGSGFDPNGGSIVSYLWTQVGGPSTATLSGNSTANLTASDLVAGSYSFQLEVTDDEGEKGTDVAVVDVIGSTPGNEAWLEAECAIVGSNWSIIDDGTASNGKHTAPPSGNNLSSGPTDPASIVTFNFTLSNAGSYEVFARVITPNTSEDSFWVRVNGGNWIKWNKIPGNSSWSWQQVHDSDNGQALVSFNLLAGANTIEIGNREDGTLLDKLFVTETGSAPVAEGSVASNCSSGTNAVARINSGGSGFVFGSETWSSDQNYNGGGSTFSNIVAIANTTNDFLYQTERNHTSSLIYNIPVPQPGDYTVLLHFAELYFGLPGGGSGGGPGSRVFDIDVEGQQQRTNYDIYVAAGAPATAVIESFTGINVIDGQMTITLTSISNSAKISGIELIEEAGAGGQPPIADAGQDQSIILPTNSITLNGTGNDPDGGSIISYLWIQSAGPSTATLTGSSTASLTASNLVEGSYTFQLEVIDDEGDSSTDDVVVIVNNASNNTDVWLEAECATVGLNWSTASVFTASNGEYVTPPTGDNLSGGPTDPNDIVAFNFTLSSAGDYKVFCRVRTPTASDDSFWVRANGGVWIKWNKIAGGNPWSWQQLHDSDNGSALVIFSLPAGSNTIEIGNREDGISFDKMYLTEIGNAPLDEGGTATNCAGGQPPVADAGSNQSMILPTNSITLNGTGNDPDGGSIVSYLWTQTGGPSTATLTNANTADLTASDLVAGSYSFQLEVMDDEGDIATDEVEVDVLVQPPGNLVIRINSGGGSYNFGGNTWSADQDYNGGGSTFSDNIAITNTANDQLYQTERNNSADLIYNIVVPQPGNYTVQLHFAELYFGLPGGGSGGGPGSRVFDIDIEGQQQRNGYDIIVAAGAPATAVIESFSGVNVTDGQLTITLSSVTNNAKLSGIEIYEESGGTSQLPVADAGPDQSITLPVNSIILNGTGNDPDGGNIVSYLWTQTAGPSTATLTNSSTADLTASDLVEGSYTFQLEVTDDESDTATDDVVVNVNGVAGSSNVWLEAECATVGSNWSTVSDAGASNGEYVQPPAGENLSSGPSNANSIVAFNFVLASGGTYKVFGRVITPSTAQDSYWVRANGGPWIKWNKIPTGSNWNWHQVHDSNNGQALVTFNLSSGSNTIEIGHREPGTLLDKIYITETGSAPSGAGSAATNCSGGGGSQPPIADAGPDQNISITSANLTATGSDPDGGSVTFSWTQTAGPNTATLSGANSANLTASNLVDGSYTFEVAVEDDENDITTDDVVVNVNTSSGGGGSVVARINSGGGQIIFGSETWSADQDHNGGKTYSNVIAIANTANDELFQTERYNKNNDLIYNITVPQPGNYTVNLYFAELYFGLPGNGSSGGPGSRVFNIDIEGQQQITNYDIIVAAGAPATAVSTSFTGVNVSDGQLTVTLTSVINNAKLSGLEVIEESPSTMASQDLDIISETALQTETKPYLRVYPNPVTDVLTFEVFLNEPESIDFRLYDSLGKLYNLGKVTAPSGHSKIPYHVKELNLAPGIYYFKLDSKQLNLSPMKIALTY